VAGDAEQKRAGKAVARRLAAPAAAVCAQARMGSSGPRWARAGHALWSRWLGSASVEGRPQGGPPPAVVVAGVPPVAAAT
jgi:hypothetical protein